VVLVVEEEATVVTEVEEEIVMDDIGEMMENDERFL